MGPVIPLFGFKTVPFINICDYLTLSETSEHVIGQDICNQLIALILYHCDKQAPTNAKTKPSGTGLGFL